MKIWRSARDVRKKYEAFEESKYGRAWTREELALGLMGDLGDFSKLALAQAGVRDIEDSQEKIAHELSDILWSVLVLADQYNVNLEQAFFETMDHIERKLDQK